MLINSAKLGNKLGPDLMHIMDSIIVHTLKGLIKNLNDALVPYGIQVNLYTNHDNFIATLYPFLKIMVRYSYRNLYNQNPITFLKDSLDPLTYHVILRYVRTKDDPAYLSDNFE